MSIHEHLRWAKGIELARRDGQHFDCATWLHKASQMPKEDFKKEVEKELTGAGDGTVGDCLFQALPEPDRRW